MAKQGKKSHDSQSADPMRLQKFLAQAGLGSRRQCEELIQEGRVSIDGQQNTTLGVRIDPNKQKVEVDGTRVRPVRHQYFMVNKPPGVVSTTADPAGRMRVIDLINTDQRVYNVGRLDKSSEGLILVTNDGELANRLTHPRYGVQKTYWVTVAGNPRWEDLQQLKRGVRLAEGVARVSEIRIRKRRRKHCELQIILDEGRNREIRRLLATIGHKVTRLRRVAIGPLHLNDLPVGSWRRLEKSEITSLQRASKHTQKRKPEQRKPVERSEMEKQRRTRKRKTTSGPDRSAKSAGKPSRSPRKRKTVVRSGASSSGTRASGKKRTRKKKPVTRATKTRRQRPRPK